MNNLSRFKQSVFLLFFILVVTGCASQPSPEPSDPVDFFLGMFHGFFILFSLIASFFSDVRIYSFPNSGLWYDFGFFIGVSIFLGGSGASTNRDKKEDND